MEFTGILLNKLQDSGKDICIFSTELSKLLYNFSYSDFDNFSKRSFYFWRENKRPIPLNVLLKVMKKSKMSKIKIEYFSVYGGNKIRFADDKNIGFCYLLGLILGDGCLCVQKRGIRKNTYSVNIVFREEIEAKRVSNLVLKLFDSSSFIYPGRGCYSLCVYSKPIVLILNKKYQIPIGKKYGSICIPRLILEGNKYMKKSFLKGIFDSDGNLYSHRGKKAVQLRQKSENFLRELNKLFNFIGIEFRDPYYDKANNSWVLWSSKKELVDNFINQVSNFKVLDAPLAQPG